MEQANGAHSQGNMPTTSNSNGMNGSSGANAGNAGNSRSFSTSPETTETDLDLESPCSVCGQDALCGGLGVIRYNVPIGDARFGKLFRCPHYPLESDQDRQMKLRKLSNLGAFADKSFENFLIDSPMFQPNEQQSLRTALDIAVKYAQKPEGWLLMEGSYGVGKTHLAAAIANTRLQFGDAVLFITSPDLLDHLRATYAPDSESTYDATFDRVRNTPLLVLDDLGVENPSPWAQEKLFQLLNHRYNYNLPTVITTNAAVEKLDARMRSRLLDNHHTHRVMITAPDHRTQRVEERLQLSSALPLYAHMTFQNFDPFTNASQEEAANLKRGAEIAWNFAHDLKDRWLLLAGGYGVGKTHLAAAIANASRMTLRLPEQIMFITVPDLIDYLKTTFGPDANVTFEQRFQQIKNVPLLVLDDIGTEAGSAWAREKLFQLIDYRYVTRKTTIFTTSKSIESLDPRVCTRLLDKRLCTLFEIKARSYVERNR
jgi:DNA replication protein DnaC